MKIDEITERLNKIKREIENAFEKELIDFDEIENELSAIIGELETHQITTLTEDKLVTKMENYI